MNKKNLKDNVKGFTLLEVLIALIILAVGILGAASMQVSSIRGNSQARQISEASSLVSDRIEIVMSRSYDDLESSNVPEVVDGYILSWIVAEDDPLPDLKRVRFIVEPPGRANQFSLDFIKSRISN